MSDLDPPIFDTHAHIISPDRDTYPLTESTRDSSFEIFTVEDLLAPREVVEHHRQAQRRIPVVIDHQDALARRRIGLGPGVEPGVDTAGDVRVDLVRDDVGEQRELEAPPLHVLVPHRRVSDLVTQVNTAPAAGRGINVDGDTRAADRYTLSADVAVGEHQASGRID